MKRIDALLKKAKKYLSKSLLAWFSGNEDNFVGALGVDPAQYERVAPDGRVGYDIIAALNDTAAEDWSEYDEGIQESRRLQGSDSGEGTEEGLEGTQEEAAEDFRNALFPWRSSGI